MRCVNYLTGCNQVSILHCGLSCVIRFFILHYGVIFSLLHRGLPCCSKGALRGCLLSFGSTCCLVYSALLYSLYALLSSLIATGKSLLLFATRTLLLPHLSFNLINQLTFQLINSYPIQHLTFIYHDWEVSFSFIVVDARLPAVGRYQCSIF